MKARMAQRDDKAPSVPEDNRVLGTSRSRRFTEGAARRDLCEAWFAGLLTDYCFISYNSFAYI